MPRGVRNTTTSVPSGDSLERSSNFPQDPAAFDELMAGLPEEMKMIETDRIAGEPPAAPMPPGFFDTANEDKVLLVNLRYSEETVLVPYQATDQHGNLHLEFSGQRPLQFIDGHLYCSRSQADYVKRVCPYVHEEPKEGEVTTFHNTGFQTRSASILAEYAARWGDNQ